MRGYLLSFCLLYGIYEQRYKLQDMEARLLILQKIIHTPLERTWSIELLVNWVSTPRAVLFVVKELEMRF